MVQTPPRTKKIVKKSSQKKMTDESNQASQSVRAKPLPDVTEKFLHGKQIPVKINGHVKVKMDEVQEFSHPGFNKSKRPFGLKGRALDDIAFEEIFQLLTEKNLLAEEETANLAAAFSDQLKGQMGVKPARMGAPRRDWLIEQLHAIQDKFGGLKKKHLKALAEICRLSETEIYEVASFYAHFDLLEDDEAYPPAITLRVCDSITCAMHGAQALQQQLLKTCDAKNVRVLHAPCMGRCHVAPVVAVGKNYIGQADVKKISLAIANGETKPKKLSVPNLQQFGKSNILQQNLENFINTKYGKNYDPAIFKKFHSANNDSNDHLGYQLLFDLRRSLAIGDNSVADKILSILNQSALRGLGGAGFPTGKKWQIVRSYPAPRFMAVNIDEGEPGTFKDYFYLSQNPHQFLLGMLIAAEMVAAERIFIYLRDEYPDAYVTLQQALGEITERGLCGDKLKGKIEIRRGAGAYICGEESAMLESIEGKRGLPRNRPPFVAEVGLFGRPTLVNNLETLYWIPEILMLGAEWWNSFNANGRKGLRSYSLSGRVKHSGMKLAPAGITVQELIDDYGGGMVDGHQFKAYLPGGASGGILPASLNNVPLDFDTLQPHGCFIGSAAIVILSDKDNLADIAENLVAFFKEESCGQCTPCRVGTEKALALMKDRNWQQELLQELTIVMTDASICGLGQAAMNPVLSVMKHFPQDFRAK